VHAAFDSNQVRWALAWRGRFVDAESVWEDRFNLPMSPLGTDVIPLPEGVPFAALATPKAPWPGSTGIDAGYRFSGYRLDARGAPAFLYEYSGSKFTDRVTPAADRRGLVRVIEAEIARPLWFRAASGATIEQQGGWFVVDSRLRVRLTGAPLRIRGGDLIAPLPVSKAVLREEIAW
jgi:hypothetical protein